ncbi:general stress protein [Amycolatopsis sp. NPDC059021]|uniref:general stress protein n=1 Tax=Amycolatopsis sp. NPDC059021 TaxID=3346704 RepID=UPI0036730DDE
MTETALPQPRRVVARYSTYDRAERAVDYLSDHRFPVEHTAIVGHGLEMVEEVSGRLTVFGATVRGALSGVIVGALAGWFFGLFGWVTFLLAGIVLALYGALFGLVIGAVVGAVGHALTGGRRDFSPTPSVRATSFDVQVDATNATEAEKLLAERGAPGLGDVTHP